MEKVNITCRLPVDDVAFLDTLAASLERDRSYLIKKAVEDYIASQRWLIDKVRGSIAQADRGDFADADEVAAAFRELCS